MLRIAGRGTDGTAKALKTDNNGIAEINLVGNQTLNANRMAYPISEPVLLNIPTYDGTGKCVHPSVLFIPEKFNGYFYWMAFTPFAGSNANLENPCVVASNDGVTWVVPTGLTNPVFSAPTVGYYADVLLLHKWDTNELYLYWCHFGDGASKGYYSKSSNGITWTARVQTSHFFSGTGISYLAPNLFVAQNKGNSPYAHSISGGAGSWITYTSVDGINFVELYQTLDNFPTAHWHPSVQRLSDGYHYISSVSNQSETPRNTNLALYYGYSPDGQNIMFDSTPLMNIDPAKFPNRRWYYSSMIPFGQQKCRVYFSALDYQEDWRIGYFDIVLNNPNRFYVNSPFYKSRTRVLFNEYELRTDGFVSYVPLGGNANQTGIPEMVTHQEKVLFCENTLKDASNANVSVNITLRFRKKEIGGTTRSIVIPASTTQVISVSSDAFSTFMITKAQLPALGVKIPGMAGILIKASAIPTSGTFTLILQTVD